MTQVISKVHSVHLMNVEHRQAAADPQTKPTDWIVSPPTSTIAIYYYSARKLTLINKDS